MLQLTHLVALSLGHHSLEQVLDRHSQTTDTHTHTAYTTHSTHTVRKNAVKYTLGVFDLHPHDQSNSHSDFTNTHEMVSSTQVWSVSQTKCPLLPGDGMDSVMNEHHTLSLSWSTTSRSEEHTSELQSR